MPRRREALHWRLTAPSLLHAYVPKPNLRLEFPPKPCQWAQLELFISWWMGLKNPERRESECWYSLQEPANAPISNPSFNSSLQLLSSELWRGSPCPNPIRACHNKSKVTANWGDSGVFVSAAGKCAGLELSPCSACILQNSSGLDGKREL